MKNFVKSILVAGILSSGANAQVQYLDDGFNNEFEKIENYVRSMLSKNLTTPLSYRGLIHPQMDMLEENDKYILKFNVAGYTKEQIQLSIQQNNLLVLSAEQKKQTKEENKTHLRQEMFFGKFVRNVQLPNNIDQDKIATKFDNGILTVIIHKRVPGKNTNRRIEIK